MCVYIVGLFHYFRGHRVNKIFGCEFGHVKFINWEMLLQVNQKLQSQCDAQGLLEYIMCKDTTRTTELQVTIQLNWMREVIIYITNTRVLRHS